MRLDGYVPGGTYLQWMDKIGARKSPWAKSLEGHGPSLGAGSTRSGWRLGNGKESHPDVVMCHALLDVLWQSRVAAAQGKKVQMLRRAAEMQGIICFHQLVGRELEDSTVVFVMGAAMIFVLGRLIDLRN